MDHQDWQTVTMKKHGASNKSTDSRTPVTAHVALLRKLDSEAPVRVKSLSSTSRQAMTAARTANSWTQVQLNTMCCFPTNTIRDIENGKTIPNGAQLTIINRILKQSLKLE